MWKNASWILLALSAVAQAAHAPSAGTPATPPAGFAGMSAERVDDPVFGASLVLYRAGKPGAEPVVLVHGLGQNGARDWAGLAPGLAANYEVFALDLPGFGQSGGGDALYSPDNYVQVLEKVIAPRVGNRPFTLIGHSLGAAVSLGYTARYPQRVKRLVLVDMAGVLQGAVYADALARNAMAGKGVPAGTFDSLLHGLLGKMSAMPLDRQVILRTPALRRKFLRGDPNTIAAFALANHDFSEALRSVTAPTLLIWGSADPIAPLRTGQLAAALIPGARLAVLPGVGHVPMAQDSARFNALVLDELAGRTTLAPYAASFTGAPSGAARKCDGEHGRTFSGDIASLTLIDCTGVEVSHARIGELRVLTSDVKLVDAQVRGGIYALRSTLELTGGSVTGAIQLDGSELDAAGTHFENDGSIVSNLGKLPVALRLSVVEVVRAGKAPRYVHDFVTVAPGERW